MKQDNPVAAEIIRVKGASVDRPEVQRSRRPTRRRHSRERRGGQPRIRTIAHWVILVLGSIFTGAFVITAAVAMWKHPGAMALALDQFPAAVLLPGGAISALCLVVFLETTSGRVEFSGLGFTFKGASGPIVMWAFCLLVYAGAIALLWKWP
jgi:hypothetical protein